jgi:endonuclease YncB( thermonuclease family)
MSTLYHYTAIHLAPSPRMRPDGDTLRVVVDLGMQISVRTAFRLARINAPELNTKAGPAARDFLRSLWPWGVSLPVQTFIDPTDKYGRWLVEVTLPDGSNLSDRMVAAGHAVYRDY